MCHMPRPLWLALLEKQDSSLHIHLALLMGQGWVCFVFPGAGGYSGHGPLLTGRETRQQEGDTQPWGWNSPGQPLPGSEAQLGAQLAYYATSLLLESKTSQILKDTAITEKKKLSCFL